MTQPAKHQFTKSSNASAKPEPPPQSFSAADYLKHTAAIEPTIVNVTVPSGFVFQFEEPDGFGLLLAGELPESVAPEILESWKEQGVTVYSSANERPAIEHDPQIQAAKKMYDATGQVLKLSRKPKIVVGETNLERNELSLRDIPKKDLSYLVKWVMAGGSAIQMMAMFPER